MGLKEKIALIATIVSAIGAIATITIFIISNRISNRKNFIEAFDKIYTKVFSLKKRSKA